MVKKINLYKNFNIKDNDKGSIILIGSFDGLHLGHRKLFERAKKLKYLRILMWTLLLTKLLIKNFQK